MQTIRGIDVSKWNDKINWPAVAGSGIRFAMVRAGVGAAKGGFSRDPRFVYNVTHAVENGIAVGVYLYSYARSVDAAREEARQLVRAITEYRDEITWPVVYDIEEDAQAALGAAICTAMCNAFCDEVRIAGYTPMVYCNVDWYRNRLMPNNIHADFWIAKWSSKKPENIPYTIWQYTDSGAVPGINGNVDLDVAVKDYSAAEQEDEGGEPPSPKPPDEADGWAADAWQAAFEKGVMDGTRPTEPMQRQQVAAVLKRLGLI